MVLAHVWRARALRFLVCVSVLGILSAFPADAACVGGVGNGVVETGEQSDDGNDTKR